jgi:predicted DCC family thiol-disulfide oxidoreductase YuxK
MEVSRTRPVLVFDGRCGMCTSSVRLAGRIDGGHDAVPWQTADLPALGLSEQRAREAVQWVDPDGRVSAGARAVARLLRHAGGGWALLGRLLDIWPASRLADLAYRFVAGHRGWFPGGPPAVSG